MFIKTHLNLKPVTIKEDAKPLTNINLPYVKGLSENN